MNIKSQVNGSNILKNIAKFSDRGDWVNEVVQNAYRAGCSEIRVTLEGEDFTIEDDGHGLRTVGEWSKVLHLAESHWKNEAALRQDPAGMGIFSALARYDAVMTSHVTTFETTPASVCGGALIKSYEEESPVEGFRLTLKGAADVFRSHLNKKLSPPAGYVYRQGKEKEKIEWGVWDNGVNIPPENFLLSGEYDLIPKEIYFLLNRQITPNGDDFLSKIVKLRVGNMFTEWEGYSVQLVRGFVNDSRLNPEDANLLINHHGQLIKESCEELEDLPHLGVFLSIRGGSPINLVHPHRERVIRDEVFYRFIDDVNKLIIAWKAEVRALHGIPYSVYPEVFCCGALDGEQVNPKGVFPEEDQLITEYHKGFHPYAIGGECNTQFYLELPRAVKEADLIINSEELQRYEETPIIETESPSGLTELEVMLRSRMHNSQIMCAITQEALGGNLLWAFTEDNDCSTKRMAPGFDAELTTFEEDSPRFLKDPELEMGGCLEVVNLSTKVVLEVKEHITLHPRGDRKGRPVKFTQPMCFHSDSPFGTRKAFVNREFRELMDKDPEQAFTLWCHTFGWTYVYTDDLTFDDYIQSEGVCTARIRNLFTRPDVSSLLRDHLDSFLEEAYPNSKASVKSPSSVKAYRSLVVKNGILEEMEVEVPTSEDSKTIFRLSEGQLSES